MYEQFMVASRVVPLEGGINFRDLGGYPAADGRQVKWRKIFRCGHLANLTEQDLDVLEYLRVTEVHDFRRREEQQVTPSRPLRANFNNDYEMHIGSMAKFWEYLTTERLNAHKSHELVVGSYRNCAEEVAPHYRRLFAALLANRDNASLFHCAAGKDRTGLAAALILSALGVPREVIIEDYLLTLQHYDTRPLLARIEAHLREAGVEQWEPEWLKPYCEVHQDNIEAFFAGVEAGYGSVDRYLETLIGLRPELRLQLQQAYLDV